MKTLLKLLPAAITLGTAFAAAPNPAQKAIAEELCSGSVQHKIDYDDEGNVIRLAISNHDGFRKDKSVPAPEPISPATFAKITGLPKLQAIALEKQKIGDAEYALLGKLKELRDVRLHYLWGKDGGTSTKDAPLFINELPLPLTVLEIKHNFDIKGGCMAQLKPQPELVKLEIDTGYCTNEAVPFIVKSPKIRNLQLHRTTITDDRFQEVLAALPDLEMLEVRPNGPKDNPITGRSLRGLKANPKLQLLKLSQHWKELPFEGGLDVLVKLPTLKYLVLAPSDMKSLTIEDAAVQQLHKARPDLLIRIGSEVLGGKPGDKVPSNDEEFNWDGGVTTHG